MLGPSGLAAALDCVSVCKLPSHPTPEPTGWTCVPVLQPLGFFGVWGPLCIDSLFMKKHVDLNSSKGNRKGMDTQFLPGPGLEGPHVTSSHTARTGTGSPATLSCKGGGYKEPSLWKTSCLPPHSSPRAGLTQKEAVPTIRIHAGMEVLRCTSGIPMRNSHLNHGWD